MRLMCLALLSLLLTTSIALAGKADVVAVKAEKGPDDSYSMAVTVSHKDEGWGHYADKWEVVAPNGDVLGTRILHHPHVNEQPFTRSLSGIKIPSGINEAFIRAHDSVHGYGGKEFRLELR